MTAAERLQSWIDAISSGKTLYVATYAKCWKIDSKTVAKFSKAGMPVLKAKGESLYMASGKSYVCIDYCGIRIV